MEGNQPNNEPPHNNMIRRPIPFFPGVFLQLMPQDILQESMNDETPDKPATKDFIDSLEEITVDQEMIDQNISCSICLEVGVPAPWPALVSIRIKLGASPACAA